MNLNEFYQMRSNQQKKGQRRITWLVHELRMEQQPIYGAGGWYSMCCSMEACQSRVTIFFLLLKLAKNTVKLPTNKWVARNMLAKFWQANSSLQATSKTRYILYPFNSPFSIVHSKILKHFWHPYLNSLYHGFFSYTYDSDITGVIIRCLEVNFIC